MKRLEKFFSENKKAALCFSGGTDSALLLKAAGLYSCDITAYYVKTRFQPEFEFEDAKKLVLETGAKLKVIEFDILSSHKIASNPPDRCYHCKRAIMGSIKNAANEDGYELIIDGTNASDKYDDRPGMKALSEYGIRSPLRELGITKDEVRNLSRELSLFTWDKPSYSCLATRVKSGTEITEDILNRVEAGETALFSMGFSDFRIRTDGNDAHLEFPHNMLILAEEKKSEIITRLSDYFDHIYPEFKGREI